MQAVMIEIPLRNRAREVIAVALVDDKDAHFAELRWRKSTTGYVVRYVGRIGPRKYGYESLHRAVMGCVRGDGREIDHRNGNPLDCRRQNLREATHAQNTQNVTAHRDARSSHRGVSWHKGADKWRATVFVDGRQKHLGFFDDELEAAQVASEFRKAHMPFTNEERLVAA